MLKAFDYTSVNSPVSEKRLTELRQWLSDSGFPYTELSCEYIAFLRESNGGDFVKGNSEFQMFAAEEISEYYSAYKFSEYMPFALPFAMDGCGYFYIFNMRECDIGVYLTSAGDLGWSGDECFLFAKSFGDCINGNFIL